MRVSALAVFSWSVSGLKVIEVDTGADHVHLGTDDALKPLLAEDYCSSGNGNCTLRTAFAFASGLSEGDVELYVDAGEDLELTQSNAIPVTGPNTLVMFGNGYTIRDVEGDSFFLVNGAIEVTIHNFSFEGFHATGHGNGVANAVVLSAEDALSTVRIEGCGFRGSFSNETETQAGLGGAIYTRGTLDIKDSVFVDNVFSIASSEPTNASSTWDNSEPKYFPTPTPTFRASPTPPEENTKGTGNSSTYAPEVAGTPTPVATNASWTTSPLAVTNASTLPPDTMSPSPVSPPAEPNNISTLAPVQTTISPSPASPVPAPSSSLSLSSSLNITSAGTNISTPSPGFAAPAPSATTNTSTPGPEMTFNTSGDVALGSDADFVQQDEMETPAPVVTSASWPYEQDHARPRSSHDEYYGSHGQGLLFYPTDGMYYSQGYLPYELSQEPGATRRLQSTGDTPASEASSGDYFGNFAVRAGPAIFWDNRAKNADNVLRISGCTFSHNSVVTTDGDPAGGAILAVGGVVNISRSVFSGNYAAFGGGLALEEAFATITSTTFTGNHADEYGGAIVQVARGSMTVRNAVFESNAAGEGGGALAVATAANSDRYNFTGCDFYGNTAGGEGGGVVYLLVDEDRTSAGDGGVLRFTSSAFEANSATRFGSIATIKCGHVVVDSVYASEYEQDDEAFWIRDTFGNCSSLSFIPSIEDPGDHAQGEVPALASARFSDLGTSFIVTFNIATDYGGSTSLVGSFVCPLLLAYPGASAADSCTWTSSTTVVVNLHYGASVVPFDNVTLLAEKVAAAVSPITPIVLNAEASATISPPENPPVPLLVPEVWYTALAHCQDFAADVSSSAGAGGRHMISYRWSLYNWSSEEGDETPDSALEYADSASTLGGWSNLTIPAEGRSSTSQMTWRFNVSATNWLGGHGWSTFQILVSSATADPPLLSLVGGTRRTVRRVSSLSIRAIAVVSTCVSANKTRALTYNWTELRTGDDLISISADPSIFKLPSHSLTVGTTYEFRVEVKDSAGLLSFATQVINVESSRIIPSIVGANRTVNRDDEVLLDLTSSIDPDEENGLCSDCEYKVACTGTASSEELCDLTLPNNEFMDGKVKINSSELLIHETYNFEVSVRRLSDTTWATAYAFFIVGGEDHVPALSITTVIVEKVNADQTIAVEAYVTSAQSAGAMAEWKLDDGVLDDYEELSFAAASKLQYAVAGAGSFSANMVLSPNALIPGSSYTFKLAATYLSDGRRLQGSDLPGSSASIALNVNSPPIGGVLEASPTTGVALTDTFILKTFAWEDEVDDLPLTYVFGYVGNSANASDTSSEVILRGAIESAEVSGVYLPQGYGPDDLLYTSLYAFDALGASSRVTFGLVVAAYDGGVEALSNVAIDKAVEALEGGYTDTLMQVLDVATSVLNAANCTAAPNCASLNRQECGTDGSREDNTCGKCLFETIGAAGGANVACVDTGALSASCSNGVQDGNETDVDCGGTSCTPCASGSSCMDDSDCLYGYCPERSEGASRTCLTPPKACPNDCGGISHGTCRYFSSVSGIALNSTDCLMDSSLATCRTSCECFGEYGGDGCQYTAEELEAAVALRENSMRLVLVSLADSELSRESVARQATLTAKLSMMPEEMQTSALGLLQQLGMMTAQTAAVSGIELASTAATALVQIIGQVTLTSAYLKEEGNTTLLSGMLSSLISAQAAGKAVGEYADEIASDFFRLSTGVYDAATVGGAQISPPVTTDDEAIDRSAPAVTLPSEISVALMDIPSVSIAVAEWIIDPRQTTRDTTTNRGIGMSTSDRSGDLVSTVVRLYMDPIEVEDATRTRRRLTPPTGKSSNTADRHLTHKRSLVEDVGHLQILIPNAASRTWHSKTERTFSHTCAWDTAGVRSSTCPDGTVISTSCTGTAVTRDVTCSTNGTEPNCASWRGSARSTNEASFESCTVASFNTTWTTCACTYATTVGIGDGYGTGSNQVDFASTFLATPAEFISIWSEVETLSWSKVQSAAEVFSTMGIVFGLALLCAGLGWRYDRKDQGLQADFTAWCASIVYYYSWPFFPGRAREPEEQPDPARRECRRPSDRSAVRSSTVRTDNLKSVVAAAHGTDENKIDVHAPHHLQDRRLKPNMRLLMMVHHDFVSVFYCYYRWFTRPQRVALLLCSVVTLMAADATVFSTIMFKDNGGCEVHRDRTGCLSAVTNNVKIGDVGVSCAWHESSRTCYVPEPEDNMDTSLVVSTIALILSLPFELMIITVFAIYVVRPTRAAPDGDKKRADRSRESEVLDERHATGSSAVASSPIGEYSHDQGPGELEARFEVELALARAAQIEEDKKVSPLRRWLHCRATILRTDAAGEARLARRVKKALRLAIALEKRMEGMARLNAQEAVLFECAECDSLNQLEQAVFQKSRILSFSGENDLTPVSAFAKYLAWIFVLIYAVGMTLYVCLFAVKAGRATSIQWMISFWVAFAEDILVLIPLKLGLIYLLLPSLMRHRMRSDMFSRIPKHAPSVQVARRRPDLQVSALILQGHIPVGSDFENFVPLYHPKKRWLGCITTFLFGFLALIMVLPDTLQAVGLDTTLALFIGGSAFGLSRLLPISLWGFMGFLGTLVVALAVGAMCHRRSVRAEKMIRKLRQRSGSALDIAGKYGSDFSGKFSGYNMACDLLTRDASRGSAVPSNFVRSVATSRRDGSVTSADGRNNTEEQALSSKASLSRWIEDRKRTPGLSGAGEGWLLPNSHARNAHSIKSIGAVSDAASRWNEHISRGHAGMDSCAASQFGDVHISDSSESSALEDASLVLGDSMPSSSGWADGRASSYSSEWSGSARKRPGKGRSALDSLNASSTFFDNTSSFQHQTSNSPVVDGARARGGVSSALAQNTRSLNARLAAQTTGRRQAHHGRSDRNEDEPRASEDAVSLWDESLASGSVDIPEPSSLSRTGHF